MILIEVLAIPWNVSSKAAGLNDTQIKSLIMNYPYICFDEAATVDEAWSCFKEGLYNIDNLAVDSVNDSFETDLNFYDSGFSFR